MASVQKDFDGLLWFMSREHSLKIDLAEYWDAPSSAMVYAYGYLKARLAGESPEPGENKTVKF